MPTKYFIKTFRLQERLQERKQAIENGSFPVIASRLAAIGVCAVSVILLAAGVTALALACLLPPLLVQGGLFLPVLFSGLFVTPLGGAFTLSSLYITSRVVFESTSVENLEARIKKKQVKMQKLLNSKNEDLEQLKKIIESLQNKLNMLQNDQNEKTNCGATGAARSIAAEITRLKTAIEELKQLQTDYKEATSQSLGLSLRTKP